MRMTFFLTCFAMKARTCYQLENFWPYVSVDYFDILYFIKWFFYVK